jgi:hypothetical protein
VFEKTLLRSLVLAFAVAFSAVAAGPPAADRTSPDAAVRAYLQAAKAGDLKAARACLHAEGKDGAVVADVFAGTLTASPQLTNAARARFGKAVDGSGLATRDKELRAYFDAALKRLDRAKPLVEKDQATLTLPDKDEKWGLFNLVESDMVLTKAADGWRIDVLKTLKLKDAGEAMRDPTSACSASSCR